MAPFRKGDSFKGKDNRRGYVGFRNIILGAFVLCTCLFLTVFELVRSGYITTGVDLEQSAHQLWVLNTEQVAAVFLPEQHNVTIPFSQDSSITDDIEQMVVKDHADDRLAPVTIPSTIDSSINDDIEQMENEDRVVSVTIPSTIDSSINEDIEQMVVKDNADGRLFSVGHAEDSSNVDRVAKEEILSPGLLISSKEVTGVLSGNKTSPASGEIFLSNDTDGFDKKSRFAGPLNGITPSRSDLNTHGHSEDSGDRSDRSDHALIWFADEVEANSEDGSKAVDAKKELPSRSIELKPFDDIAPEEVMASGGDSTSDKVNDTTNINNSRGDDGGAPSAANKRDFLNRNIASKGWPSWNSTVTEHDRSYSGSSKDNGNRDKPISNATNLRQNGTSDITDMFETNWDIPRAISRNWTPPKRCATAEEMGSTTMGDTRDASLRVRAMIRHFIIEHGTERVGRLAGEEFCRRGFVLGQSQEDGFGNNMYKVLTAAGLAIMLNRSLIIGERGSTDPAYFPRKKVYKPAFGDYLDFSNQTFTMREVKRLWAIHRCETKYKRPLVIHNDILTHRSFRTTSCICDDWTTLTAPILHFQGATGSGALQLLLKNSHPAMRYAAAKLLGHPAIPSTRPNTFGELFRAFIAPNADIEEAVQWALKGGPDPEIALHLRMLHSRTRPAPAAASSCISRIKHRISTQQAIRGRRPRVVVVTDTPAILPGLQKSLGQEVEVVRFNYVAFIKEISNRSEVLSLQHGRPPRHRMRDWGEMPRWVAMVDFFLAARARTAVVSGAYSRVSTTYAQLVAALAAAYTLEEDTSRPACVYYSSFQASLLSSGLATQSGWGHTWRPFAGRFGCKNQPVQCALTALMPYTWWDAPWQAPISQDIKKLQGFAGIDASGQVSERQMDSFCAAAKRNRPPKRRLHVPSYDVAIAAS